MGAREWIEEKVDKAKQYYGRNREDRVEQRAVKRYIEREAEIDTKEDIDPQTGSRRGVSEELATKWRKRAGERYARESVPREKRYFTAFVGGVKSDWSSARGNIRRATSPKGIKGSRKDYSRAAGSALLGSGPGSHRSTQQFGNFLLTGSSTKQSTASGWGILLGTRRSSGGSRRGGRRGKKKDGGGGSGGIGFL